MLVRIAKWEDPDQTTSLGLHCLLTGRLFWQATSVGNI